MTKTLVLISPVAPKPTGSGRHMRAYQFVRRYAAEYSLIVISPEDPAPEAAALVARHIKLEPAGAIRTFLVRLFSRLPPSWQDRLWPARPPYPERSALHLNADARSAIRNADVVLVFRLYMMPLLLRLPERNKVLWLDLDDWDSRCHERIARLARSEHRTVRAWQFQALAEAFRKAENDWLPLADRVFVCSDEDRRDISAAQGLANVEVFANRYCGPIMEMEQRARPGDAHILFVGAMGYLPNQDAVRWFCRDIWPKIKAGFNGRVQFHVVGAGTPTAMRLRLQADASVVVHGFLDDLSDAYRQADVVVCPVRAGGGTRIKILEAVAHTRAVVTTPLGVEGLDFDADHLAIAEGAQAFGDAVLALLAAPETRQRLCSGAVSRLKEKYWLPENRPASRRLVAPALDGL